MKNRVTIATFTLPTEMALARARLESEGIECFAQDEMTVQVHNFYSQALGGIKLQVAGDDVIRAMHILKEGGFTIDTQLAPPAWISNTLAWTERLPLFNRLGLIFRVMLLVLLIALGVGTVAYWLLNPGLTQQEKGVKLNDPFPLETQVFMAT